MKNKKVFLLLLIIPLIVFFIGRSFALPDDEEEEEPEEDNWELSAVFYDSTVDNGNTPLTEINWDATDGTLKEGEERIITIQINYKNSNVIKTYKPGDLIIRVPKIANNNSTSSNNDGPFKVEIIVGANDDNHTNYDWNYLGVRTFDYYPETNPNHLNHDVMLFTNNNTIEAKSNIEGSIQILYKLKPISRSPVRYEDSVLIELKKAMDVLLLCPDYDDPQRVSAQDGYNYIYENPGARAMMFQFPSGFYTYDYLTMYNREDNKIFGESSAFYLKMNPYIIDGDYVRFKFRDSNSYRQFYYIPMKVYESHLSFNYSRLYEHSWTKKTYNIHNDVNSSSSIDNFPSNYNDYIWVNLRNNTDLDLGYSYITYPNIGVDYEHAYIKDILPEGVLVYDKNMNLIDSNSNEYVFSSPSDYSYLESGGSRSYGGKYIMLAFPKSTYNESNNNMTVTINSELWGIYANEQEYVKLSDCSNTIDLTDYNIVVPNGDYGVNKTITGTKTELYSQDLRKGIDNTVDWGHGINVNYTGIPYNIKIGDDLLFYTDSNGNIEKLSDDDYFFSKVYMSGLFYSSNDKRINENEKYDCELWVRYRGDDSYSLYSSFKYKGHFTYTFSENEKVVGYYLIIKNLVESIHHTPGYTSSLTGTMVFEKSEITDEGILYNFDYFDTYYVDENENIIKLNNVNSDYYSNLLGKYNNRTDITSLIPSIINEIKEYDLDSYNEYKMRSFSIIDIKKYIIPNFNNRLITRKGLISSSFNEDVENEIFTGTMYLKTSIWEMLFDSDIIVEKYGNEIDEIYFIKGIKGYDLLPLGMELKSSEQEMKESLSVYWETYYSFVFDKNLNRNLTKEEFLEIAKNNLTINIINNYKGTNRTLISYSIDLTNNPILLSNDFNYTAKLDITLNYNFEVSYNAILEYGFSYRNYLYAEVISPNQYNKIGGYNGVDYISNSVKDNGHLDEQAVDINNNGDENDSLAYTYYDLNIVSVVSTNQDVQISVQTDKSNYNTGKVETSKDSEYTYKLRVRTGTSDVTNLVIYDSLEDYAKNPQLEIIKASGGKQYWQGQLIDIDTSYAESKGYKVKVYYNENSKPGTLAEDNTWQEYTDSTDKSIVKAFAFKYLNEDGTEPALLPENSLTYVLIKMKSPNVDYITYAYNGCWTEWNAIDPITERPVDFITGINSNIVKVSLPHSVDIEEVEKTLTKKWVDGNNALNVRPNNVSVHMVVNGDDSNSFDIVLTGTGNEWTTNISIPEFDMLGEESSYLVTENPINIDEPYKYIAEVDGLTITNTLYKDITLKKIWKDNNGIYLTRPSSVTYKVKQNENDYKTVTFSGDLTSNEWEKVITVPVFDNDGNGYSYSIEEVSVEGYSTSCDLLTCTNTLTGNDTITINKVWIDNDNSYNTRPNSIDIKLKQNGNDYQTVTLSGNTNTWESDSITIPRYDNNGVKYTYTISEEQFDDYGLVVYDQANYQVTNTLKKNINITVTKKWVDGSNEQGIRPDELKINLLRNNNQYQELTLTGNEDTWTTTIEVPKYDDNQKEYVYSIREITNDLNSDYSNITYGEDLSVTNKLEKKKSINISKTWDDYNNIYMTRPEKVTINILRNGELYQELELNNNDSWKKEINDLDVYDDTGKLYKYTIEENLSEQLNRYQTITYDQTSFTINNKLTITPKVTLYFTVKNGYLDSSSGDLKFDQEGLNRVMNMHKLNTDTAYEYDFELENVDTGEIKKAKLSTEGTLKFEDIPYGTYRARESEDKYFKFVDMVEIENVSGVTFTEDDMGGTITISPTGKDIIYGTNTTNRIEPITPTPITSANRNYIIVYLLLIIGIFIGLYYYKKKVQ